MDATNNRTADIARIDLAGILFISVGCISKEQSSEDMAQSLAQLVILSPQSLSLSSERCLHLLYIL